MTGLIPLYLKTYYKKEPVFAHSKVIYTIGNKSFEEGLGDDFSRLININNSLKEKELEPFKEANNIGIMRGGATYSDAITFGAEKIDKKLVDEFGKVKGKKVVNFNAESDLTEYLNLYTDLSK